MTIDFNDYFWGDKNSGFEVLYHNMKYGLAATKDLSDFLREKSNIEEHNSKQITKLAGKVASGCVNGTFAPVWVVLKSSTERLASLHQQMVHKLTELVKDVSKYADEVHKKQKNVKDEEASTLEAVQAMQSSTQSVQKSKDVYLNRLADIEKLRKDNGSAKDIEKAEVKLRKISDDYKALCDKHIPIKNDFERKMSITCRKFQEIEENHLKQMKEFLSTYIELLQSNHDMVGQVHLDFKRQYIEMPVDKLLEQFVLSKYTGIEKPDIAELNFPVWSKSGGGSRVENVSISSHSVSDRPIGPSSATSPALESGRREWSAPATTTISSPPAGSQTTAAAEAASASAETITNASTAGALQIMPSPFMVPRSLEDDSGPKTAVLEGAGDSFTATNKNKPPSLDIVQPLNTSPQPQPERQPQQKSSRRTTSLLNLFMSNSQGMQGNREIRDSASTEVLSAPTSPGENNQIGTHIGRNPLRGSKLSAILRSGRNKAKTKKLKSKNDFLDVSNTLSKDTSMVEEKDEHSHEFHEANNTTSVSPANVSTQSGSGNFQNQLVDEDGYSIQPKEPQWETLTNKKEIFYSDTDSDSEAEEPERKIHVEIKPLNNGVPPISASVDELRATVETLSLSPLGGVLSQPRDYNQHHQQHKEPQQTTHHTALQQSPTVSNASTPTSSHPYAPLQSPTFSISNASNRYADLGDIFSEIGDISGTANLGSAGGGAANNSTGKPISSRQIPTPTSATGSIAIPRPPSRRSESATRGRISPATISRADSVGSLEFRTASIGFGSSRGPSPLTIGISDTIPLAVAFHEVVHAYFRGSDESRCQVKMTGDMMLSFPAGIVGVLANNPNPASLGFRIKHVRNLESILPNKQLVTVDAAQSNENSTVLNFNMSTLTALLRRQYEQNPAASYFNVDILKYQIRVKQGACSCPFQLVCYWKCEPMHTDIKIDYKYNSHAMAVASPLLNVAISVPVDGAVRNVQSRPHSAWMGESNRLQWNFTDISQHSDNNGVGTLRARLEVANGPSTPAILTAQFNCEGTTVSGIEFELVGNGYRLSLVKRRFVSGKYICEGDGIRNSGTPTPQPQLPYNKRA